jgi:membrane protease YdiL (CAAX protease family)
VPDCQPERAPAPPQPELAEATRAAGAGPACAPAADAEAISAESRPPRPAGPPLVALVEVVLGSGFPTQLALGAILMAVGLTPYLADGRLSMTYLAVLMPADTAVLLAFVAWRLRAGGEQFTAVLFGRRDPARESWLGVGLIPVVLAGAVAVMAALRAAWPALHNVDANPFEALIRSRADALLLAVLVVVTGGVKEEVQRAFVLHRFGQRLGGARLGLVLYSLVFGTGHIIQGYDVAVVTALLGLAWGGVFLWRRSLVAPSISHAGFNAAQVLQFVVFGS